MRYRIPWLTCASVLGIVVQYVMAHFGLELPSPVLNALITLVCGVLAVAGVVAPSASEEEREDGEGEDSECE